MAQSIILFLKSRMILPRHGVEIAGCRWVTCVVIRTSQLQDGDSYPASRPGLQGSAALPTVVLLPETLLACILDLGCALLILVAA